MYESPFEIAKMVVNLQILNTLRNDEASLVGEFKFVFMTAFISDRKFHVRVHFSDRFSCRCFKLNLTDSKFINQLSRPVWCSKIKLNFSAIGWDEPAYSSTDTCRTMFKKWIMITHPSENPKNIKVYTLYVC